MEAIGHLPEALIGAKIIPQPKEPKDKLPSLCEECHLANFLQCQISRYPPQRATKPFELEWIPHSMETIGLCILFAIRPEPFRLYVSSEPTLKTAFVKWQYNVEIQIWHTDGKKTMEIIWQLMLMQQQQVFLMQRLWENDTDNDSSSGEYNDMSVDSGSDTDIGYEADITEGDADMDADEGGNGDGNHDTSDFAELFDDNDYYLTSDSVVPPPQVINNGATTETTITHDVEGNSTSIPILEILSHRQFGSTLVNTCCYVLIGSICPKSIVWVHSFVWNECHPEFSSQTVQQPM